MPLVIETISGTAYYKANPPTTVFSGRSVSVGSTLTINLSEFDRAPTLEDNSPGDTTTGVPGSNPAQQTFVAVLDLGSVIPGVQTIELMSPGGYNLPTPSGYFAYSTDGTHFTISDTTGYYDTYAGFTSVSGDISANARYVLFYLGYRYNTNGTGIFTDLRATVRYNLFTFDAISQDADTATVILSRPTSSSGPRSSNAGDETDMAQDRVTGQIFQIKSVGGVLQAQAWEGWTNLAGTPARAYASILDATTGAAIGGTYPSLCMIDSEGRASVCYVNAANEVVRRDSYDGLLTLN